MWALEDHRSARGGYFLLTFEGKGVADVYQGSSLSPQDRAWRLERAQRIIAVMNAAGEPKYRPIAESLDHPKVR